jgi:hypothetical protein
METQETEFSPNLKGAYNDGIELIRRKVMNGDSNLFIEHVMKDEKTGNKVKQDIIHFAIQEHIDYCFSHNLLCGILAPWGHGKTSQVIGKILHEIGLNSNIRVKILCNNDSTAKARLKVIGQYVDSDPDFHSLFPTCVPADKENWNAHELTVLRNTISKDSTVQCYGVLSSGIGGRTDILLADDVMDMRNCILQPKLKVQIIDTFFNTWLSRADGEDFRVIYIATVWTDDDLSSQLLKNPAFSFLVMGINSTLTAIKCKYFNRELKVA